MLDVCCFPFYFHYIGLGYVSDSTVLGLLFVVFLCSLDVTLYLLCR